MKSEKALYEIRVHESWSDEFTNNVNEDDWSLGVTWAVSEKQAVNNYCWRTKSPRYNTDGVHWTRSVYARKMEGEKS